MKPKPATKLLSKKAITVWVAVAAILGTGSFAIAVGAATHQESPPDIQQVSDQKIHLQDVDGKIQTNVPVAASRAFSPLPIEFDEDDEAGLDIVDEDAIGSEIITKQKVVINAVFDVSTDTTWTFPIVNNSEDDQIFLVKAGAPSQVILDAEDGSSTTVHGLTGHNEWLLDIDGSSGDFDIEVSVTDAGFYPIVVELLRVG